VGTGWLKVFREKTGQKKKKHNQSQHFGVQRGTLKGIITEPEEKGKKMKGGGLELKTGGKKKKGKNLKGVKELKQIKIVKSHKEKKTQPGWRRDRGSRTVRKKTSNAKKRNHY